MKTLTKGVRRIVTIKGRGEDLPERQWIVWIDPHGIAFRRVGTKEWSWRMTWKQAIAACIAHALEIPPQPKRRKETP